MRWYWLDPIEEILVLMKRIDRQRNLILFGIIDHDKGVKKLDKMLQRVIDLGGNPHAEVVLATDSTRITNTYREVGKNEVT